MPINKDPNFWLAVGSGLLSGGTAPQQIGNMGQNLAQYNMTAQQKAQLEAEKAQQQALQNKTLQFIQQQDPELAQAVASGAMTGPDAYKMLVQRRAEAAKPITEKVGENLYERSNGAWKLAIQGQQDATKGLTELSKNAIEAGYQRGTPEYQEFMKRGMLKKGMSITTNPDGTTSIEMGGNTSDLKEWQSKDILFTKKADGAEAELRKYEGSLTSLKDFGAANAGPLGNYAKSEDYQKAEQAGREFIAAVLRKETGAAVTPQEFDYYSKIYLPLPGDPPSVVSMKREARQRFIDSMKSNLGMPSAAPSTEGASGDPLGLRN